jgi:hypothetical protein
MAADHIQRAAGNPVTVADGLRQLIPGAAYLTVQDADDLDEACSDWLRARGHVCGVLDVTDDNLTPEQQAVLDAALLQRRIYPYYGMTPELAAAVDALSATTPKDGLVHKRHDNWVEYDDFQHRSDIEQHDEH